MIELIREPFASIRDEIEPLWQAHFSEVCRDRDAVPLDVDVDTYAAMDVAGELIVVSARRASQLVGYAFALVGYHRHHRSTVVGQMDMYYLCPDCRGGRTAFRLFRAVESEVRAAGAVRFTIETLSDRSHSRLLRRLGYAPNEIMHTKLLRAA